MQPGGSWTYLPPALSRSFRKGRRISNKQTVKRQNMQGHALNTRINDSPRHQAMHVTIQDLWLKVIKETCHLLIMCGSPQLFHSGKERGLMKNSFVDRVLTEINLQIVKKYTSSKLKV